MKLVTHGFSKNTIFPFEDISGSDIVYKYVTFDAIADIFKRRRFKMSRVVSWPDPYECAYFKTVDLIDVDGKKGPFFTDYDKYFGSSWTLNKDSDAMWKLYSRNEEGVLLTTNISYMRKYINKGIFGGAIYFGSGQHGPANDFFNAKRNLEEHILTLNLSEEEKECSLLLLKHYAYMHEREVRFILASDEKENSIYFEIDPIEFVQGITLDPRMSTEKVEMYSEYFIKLGYNKKIHQSKLYDINLGSLARTKIMMASGTYRREEPNIKI